MIKEKFEISTNCCVNQKSAEDTNMKNESVEFGRDALIRTPSFDLLSTQRNNFITASTSLPKNLAEYGQITFNLFEMESTSTISNENWCEEVTDALHAHFSVQEAVQMIAYLASLNPDESPEWRSLRITRQNNNLFKEYVKAYIKPNADVYTIMEGNVERLRAYLPEPDLKVLLAAKNITESHLVQDIELATATSALPIIGVGAGIFLVEAAHIIIYKWLIKKEIDGVEAAKQVGNAFASTTVATAGSFTGGIIGLTVSGGNPIGMVAGGVVGGILATLACDLGRKLYEHFFGKPQEAALEEAYKFLEIPSNASHKEVLSAYKTMALVHHPDKGGCEEKFKKLVTAYLLIKASRSGLTTKDTSTNMME